MNRLFNHLKTIARAYYQRLTRKIRHISGSFGQQKSDSLKPIKPQADPFIQQQGLSFCKTFPEHPLQPNTLLPGDSNTNTFWYRLTGHAKGHYSLAIVNRALAAALYKMSNAQTCFIPFDDGLKKSVEQMPVDTEPTLKLAISNAVPLLSDRPDRRVVSIVHHYPVIIDDEPADIRLIIFFWEESLVPAETVTILNEKFDAILVASSFVATVLRNSGCAKPIFVIPMGVDHVVDYSAPLSPLPSLPSDKHDECFRFLHVSSVFDRKGPEFLLAAFIAQFSAQDPVELYIKTFPNPHNRIHEQLAHFLSTKPNPPRVIIDEAEISSDALQSLYRSAHTLVLPTRGEGFNLPAAEALALGLPVIVTGFGAQIDFCTTTTASLIPFRFDLSQSHLNQGEGCWLTPDVRALATLMQQSVDTLRRSTDQQTQQNQKNQSNQLDALTQRRAAGHALMRSTYTWDRAALGVMNALHRLTTHGTVEQDVTIKKLTFRSPAAFLTLTAERPKEDVLLVTLDKSRLENILSDNTFDDVLKALASLTKQGKILLLELISEDDSIKLSPPLPPALESEQAKAFFQYFDRVIVQSVNDLNRLLQACEPRVLMLLPNEACEETAQNTHTARNNRLLNMVKGLKNDRLFDLANKQFASKTHGEGTHSPLVN